MTVVGVIRVAFGGNTVANPLMTVFGGGGAEIS